VHWSCNEVTTESVVSVMVVVMTVMEQQPGCNGVRTESNVVVMSVESKCWSVD
jgi:hypothetical protein